MSPALTLGIISKETDAPKKKMFSYKPKNFTFAYSFMASI
jgi:hypothetical protein